MEPAASSFAPFPPLSVSVTTPKKELVTFSIRRPDQETVQATHDVMKKIFTEAFKTNYTHYYNEAKPGVSIEQWLRIKTDVDSWLSETFDEEYQEYEDGKKGFIHLYDPQNNVV